MKNPLALFTGAALATLVALVGLNLTDWPRSTPDGQKPAEAAVETPKPAGEAATQAPETSTEIAALPAPEPPKTNTEGKVDLDTVRVESDGQTVVAGTAKPGDEISLKLGEKVIGKGVANSDGSWVVVPDQPLPKGGHEITIEQKTGEAAPVLAEKSIAVVVPENAGQEAMVALTEPGSATKVLQAGGNEQQASLSGTAAEPAPDQPKAPEAAEKPAEPTPQPKAEEPGATVLKSAEGTKPAGTTQPEPDTTTVAKAEDLPEAVKPPESAQAKPDAEETAENVALGLDAVDYNDKGDIIFSGRARPGTAVRLYVDNRAVGDAFVDAKGKWSFAGKDIIAPGTHDLRVDQIDRTGKVVARIGLPFLRENAEAVAALTETPQPAQTSEAEPSSPAVEQTTQQKTTADTKVAVAQAETTPPAAEQKTTEAQPATEQPAQKAAEPQSQAAAEQPQPAATTQQPEAGAPQPEQPARTAEAEPPQASAVQKTAPEASGPAPEQPVAADKKEELTTAAAVAAEQAAKTIDPNQPRSGKVVIQPGNNLWKLSRVIYGRGKNYTVIYQANKDVIRNPARIYPGQIFAIPGASPPEQIDPKRKDPLTSAEGGAAQ